jgi:hypothetical protein
LTEEVVVPLDGGWSGAAVGRELRAARFEYGRIALGGDELGQVECVRDLLWCHRRWAAEALAAGAGCGQAFVGVGDDDGADELG